MTPLWDLLGKATGADQEDGRTALMSNAQKAKRQFV